MVGLDYELLKQVNYIGWIDMMKKKKIQEILFLIKTPTLYGEHSTITCMVGNWKHHGLI